jgi:hypothetical protein
MDIYIQTVHRRSAEAAVIEYGNAIKDLAVSNIFPGDIRPALFYSISPWRVKHPGAIQFTLHAENHTYYKFNIL